MSKIVIGSMIGVFFGLWLFIASVFGIGFILYTVGQAKIQQQAQEVREQIEQNLLDHEQDQEGVRTRQAQ